MKNIIGVRFKKLGKIYFFNPKGLRIRKGDKVIVSKYAGTEVKLDGEEYIIVKQDDILDIVE